MKLFCKICGMTRQEDLNKAQELGVKMCGFIFHTKSPRGINVKDATFLQSGNMLRVGVFVEQTSEEILDIMQNARLDYAQLHGKQGLECAQRIGEKIGYDKIIRVLWPEKYKNEQDFVDDLEKFHNTSAYFLLDAGKSGGGGGKNIDLKKLAYLKNIQKPWILAGGLYAENLKEILPQLQETSSKIPFPNGVDCNSALECDAGIKDHARMEALCEVLKEYQK